MAEPVVLTGKVGENYTTESKEIAGYSLKEIKGNEKGQFTEEAQAVVYIYQQTGTIGNGTVTVKYQDKKGNSLAEDNVLTGVVGNRYEIEAKKIDGYELIEVQGSEKGNFTEKAQTVLYTYQPVKSTLITTTTTFEQSNGWRGSYQKMNGGGKVLPHTGSTISPKLFIYGIVVLMIVIAIFIKEKIGRRRTM